MIKKTGIKSKLLSTWWVIPVMIILTLACSLGPVSLTWREPTPESETAMEPEATFTAAPLDVEAAPLVATEVLTQEEATPTTAAITEGVVEEEFAPIPHAIPVGSDYRLMFVYRGQIYWLDLNTTAVHPFWEGVGVRSVRLSPDQDYLIYYPREYETSTPPVVFHHLATGQEIQYELIPPEERYSTTWGPVEKSITYSVYDYDYAEDGVHGIYIFHLESGETETLIEDDIYTVYWVRSWSPDGERLIFSRGPNFSTGFNTHIFNLETQETTELACRACRWSPDGRYIAGVDVEFYYRIDAPLFLIDVARGEMRVLYEREGFTADGPVWSPDGNWIAFTLYDVDEELLQQEYIYKRQDIPLLIDAQGQNLLEIPVIHGQPILWSPDSSQVLLSVGHARLDRGDGQSLYLYDLNENEAYLIFEFEDSWAGSLQFIEACVLGCD